MKDVSRDRIFPGRFEMSKTVEPDLFEGGFCSLIDRACFCLSYFQRKALRLPFPKM